MHKLLLERLRRAEKSRTEQKRAKKSRADQKRAEKIRKEQKKSGKCPPRPPQDPPRILPEPRKGS